MNYKLQLLVLKSFAFGLAMIFTIKDPAFCDAGGGTCFLRTNTKLLRTILKPTPEPVPLQGQVCSTVPHLASLNLVRLSL
jgi:hypothetical protein